MDCAQITYVFFHSWAMVGLIFLYLSIKKYCNGLIKHERFYLQPNFQKMLSFITFMELVGTLLRVYGMVPPSSPSYFILNMFLDGLDLTFKSVERKITCIPPCAVQLWKFRLARLRPTGIAIFRCNESLSYLQIIRGYTFWPILYHY